MVRPILIKGFWITYYISKSFAPFAKKIWNRDRMDEPALMLFRYCGPQITNVN